MIYKITSLKPLFAQYRILRDVTFYRQGQQQQKPESGSAYQCCKSVYILST